MPETSNTWFAWYGRELTTEAVVACAHEIEKKKMREIVDRPRSLEGHVREFMITNCQGTVTTKPEFLEAVRHYLDGRWS